MLSSLVEARAVSVMTRKSCNLHSAVDKDPHDMMKHSALVFNLSCFIAELFPCYLTCADMSAFDVVGTHCYIRYAMNLMLAFEL